MKRIVSVFLCLLLGLVSALPAFSQGGENAAWQGIQDQRDTRQQAALIENFIRTYPNSPHRPDVDKMLLSFWVSNTDHAKIVNHVDGFKQSLPSADNASKGIVYAQGMISAATMNNVKKTVEFGNLALTADPNNFTVLSFLASSNLLDAKTTVEYATRAVALPMPATMAEAQYRTWLGRVEGIVALSLMSENKFKESLVHFEKALKANPKDHSNQFRYGYASLNVMGDAAKAATAANDDLIRAMSATPTVQADVDKAKANVEAQSKAALELRDGAMEALAKAVAIGGQYATQSKQLLDQLYQNKKQSLDGEDQYIAEKKKELGL